MTNTTENRDWYLALPDPAKQIALALVANYLTIHGRSFSIDLIGDEKSRAFAGLNELQHQLSGHIAAIGLQRDRYDDDVLWNILTEKAAFHGLTVHLNQSFNYARLRDFWPSLMVKE